jgi:hypothetical protein
VRVDGADIRWSYTDTNRSGIYTIRYDAPVNREELFAVNVDPRESNLQRFDPELLPSQLSVGHAGGRAGCDLADETANRYFRHLLGLLLVLLLVESSWAWYLGNASA